MSEEFPPQPNSDPALDRFTALLTDLQALGDYLHTRGRKTYENAQKFADNARKHPESRAYDERQATMLEYQHYIWQEIAGLVDRLVTTYSVDNDPDLDSPPAPNDSE